MPDKDIYGKTLGKGFLKVRALLSGADDEAAAQAVAEYVDTQIRKQVRVEELVAAIAPAIGPQSYFFSGSGLLADLERTVDTLAGEHFVAAVREARETGGSDESLIADFVERAVGATACRLELQKDYRDDASVQRRFALVRERIVQLLVSKLKGRCGMDAAPNRTTIVIKDQTDLLRFEIPTE